MKPILVVILAAAIFVIPLKRGVAESNAKHAATMQAEHATQKVTTIKETSLVKTPGQPRSFLHGEMLFNF